MPYRCHQACAQILRCDDTSNSRCAITKIRKRRFGTTAVGIYTACWLTLLYGFPHSVCADIRRSCCASYSRCTIWRERYFHSPAVQIPTPPWCTYSRGTTDCVHKLDSALAQMCMVVHHHKGRTQRKEHFGTNTVGICTAWWLSLLYGYPINPYTQIERSHGT